MRRSRRVLRGIAFSALVIATLTTIAVGSAAAAPAPVPGDFDAVPSRTQLSFVDSRTGVKVETANAHDARPGLSTVKLYIADYVLRSGDGSVSERDLAERMIRASDDNAASTLDTRYPGAIDATAARFGLTSTRRGGFWGTSVTSVSDTATFLEATKRDDPTSPVLAWMATADPVANDGTVQNWGTGQLAGVVGSKWGWADDISSAVSSASYGADFSVAAATYGPADAQTTDVLGALGRFDLQPAPVVPVPQPPFFPDLFALLSGS